MFEQYNLRKIEFNKKFVNYFPKDKFGDILNYSINEGKRIRPIILLETYKMISDNVNQQLANDFAIALELIHNYSLIHDDLPAMDNDNYRRGRKTTHYKFGEDYAILAGDALLNYAYELVFDIIKKNTKINVVKAGEYLAKSSGYQGMIKGQIIDINDSISNDTELMEMYKNKTCKLIMASTTIPGYLDNKNSDIIRELELLGFYIGMAFQIQDDLLDIESDSDIGKVTYVTLKGEKVATSEMIEYSNKALDILKKYEKSEFLIMLIKRLVHREH